MFGLRRLAGFIQLLKRLLARRVAVVLAETGGQDSRLVERACEGLFEYYEVLLRLMWFASVMFIMAEAKQRGGMVGFVPASRGVSPDLVLRVLREEMRVTKTPDGAEVMAGNLDDVAKRVANRLGTYIPAVERQTVVDMVDTGLEVQEKIRVHREKHGHPLVNLVKDATDSSSVLGRVLNNDEKLASSFHAMVEDWRNDIVSTTGGVLRVGRYDLDEFEREIREKQLRSLYEAELFLGLRDTIPEITGEDVERQAVFWARIPVGSYTCGFCLMLCSRGAVYRKDTALSAKNRVKKRLTPFVGRWGDNAYHENCDCMMVPVYSWDDYAGKDLVDGARVLWKHYRQEVKKQASRQGKNPRGWLDPKLFSAWLRAHPELVAEMPTFDM